MRERRNKVLNKYITAYHIKINKGVRVILSKQNYMIKCFMNY
jgi:hypothetical protein